MQRKSLLLQGNCFLLFFVFMLFANTNVFSDTVPPILIHELHLTEFIPKRTPEGDFGNRIRRDVKALKANNGSELLYSFEIANNLFEGLKTEELDLTVMQTLFSVNKRKGLQYYSHLKKEYSTSIIDIYRIKSVKDRQPLEDLRVDKLHSSISSFIFQKDDSGDFVFNYDVYYNRNHTFYLTLANQLPAYYKSFIYIGPPKALNTQYIIQRDNSNINIYGISFSKIGARLKSIRTRAAKTSLYKMYSTTQWIEREVTKNLNLLYVQNN